MRGPPGARADTFTLVLAGDTMLGRGVAETTEQRGIWWPWGDVHPRTHGADLFAINLECTITTRTERWTGEPGKPFFFRAPPGIAESLHVGGVHFCALANNHAVDFGPEGVVDTVRYLDAVGIRHAGAGATLHDARAPARMVRNGWRISFLACADAPSQAAAGPATPGIHWIPIPPDPEALGFLQAQIAVERAHADVVVVSVHWGPNLVERPSPEFQVFAKAVIDAGADVFWGHSAHVVHGIGTHRGRPILYDTGDLVDDYVVDRWLRNDLGALFLVRFGPEGVREVEAIPTKVGWRQAKLAVGADRTAFVEAFTRRCRELGTEVDHFSDLVRVHTRVLAPA